MPNGLFLSTVQIKGPSNFSNVFDKQNTTTEAFMEPQHKLNPKDRLTQSAECLNSSVYCSCCTKTSIRLFNFQNSDPERSNAIKTLPMMRFLCILGTTAVLTFICVKYGEGVYKRSLSLMTSSCVKISVVSNISRSFVIANLISSQNFHLSD